MNKNDNAFGMENTFCEKTDTEWAVEYFNDLLARTGGNENIEAADAISLSALAASINKFLNGSETERRSAITLKTELCKIAGSSKHQKKNQSENLENKTLYTSDGRIVYLGPMLGSGGEGVVYKISNLPGKAAKIFRSTVDADYMERKVDAIINKHIPLKLDNIQISTIPEISLYDTDDSFLGYMMPYIATDFKLYDVMRDSMKRRKNFPDLDYRGMIVIAYNLAEVVHCMHSNGVVIGDLNPANIAVNTDGTVCLIDTDSFDIVDEKTKEHFPCSVGFAELLAPELQALGDLTKGGFTKASDLFALSIIIFRLLMNNADPFAGVRTNLEYSVSLIPDNEPIMNGECPYIKKIDDMRLPDWAPSFDILPEYIQSLFRRCFDYDRDTYENRIKERPGADEWMYALMRFCNEPLVQCKKNP